MAEQLPAVVVITCSQAQVDDVPAVQALVAAGARIHLRKPGMSSEQLQRWCAPLDDTARQALTLHGPLSEAQSLGCGGWHHPTALAGQGLRSSRSWHALDEPAAVVDYGFLSPIWPSTSKAGYAPTWSEDELIAAATRWPVPVYALAGVTPERAAQARALGCCGVAVLGWLWQDFQPGAVLRRYRVLCRAVQ